MKVKDLLLLLASCDAEAEVVLMSQPNWPIEHALAGIASREECRGDYVRRKYEPGTSPGDVVLVEGAWLRYGEGDAWGAVRRRNLWPNLWFRQTGG